MHKLCLSSISVKRKRSFSLKCSTACTHSSSPEQTTCWFLHLLLQGFLLNTLLFEDWFLPYCLMHCLCPANTDHHCIHLSSTPGAARRVAESDPCDSHSFRCVTSTRGVQFSVGHCVMRAIQVQIQCKAPQACEWECIVVALCTTSQAVRTLSQVKSSPVKFYSTTRSDNRNIHKQNKQNHNMTE
jgi:hypothetical protein